jgi:pimeloyl-ACP methyl ester carboxylesterase
MYAGLLPRVAGPWRLVAPDFPGFGHSAAPPPESFRYTFDHLAEATDAFTRALGIGRYALYLQDYGGPVGMRLAVAHPERLSALVVQNAVMHEEGLVPEIWNTRRAFWADRATHEAALRANFLSEAATRTRHVGHSPNDDRYDPDLWTDELAFLSRPGQERIQADLFFDYRTNVASYPAWQAWLREARPPLLVLWGRWDPSFSAREVEALRRDHPGAEAHVLDGGHFALDEATPEIAPLLRAFLDRVGR